MAEFTQPYAATEQRAARGQRRKKSAFLFLTSKPILSECFVQAIESEFPHVTATQFADLHAACNGTEMPVSLIFVDLALFDQLAVWAPLLARAHPGSVMALLQTDTRRSVPVAEILRSELVCGVLPMHLKLDIWLSVIRLLLLGGDYIPATMLRTLLEEIPVGVQQTPAAAQPAPASDPRYLDALTEREMQILELVARGLQNKVIAAALQLSEHTVKIHLHNIISKLGTSNRTQAAAIFHRSRSLEAQARMPVPPAAQPPALMLMQDR